eukprot:16445090-Heterocapsa_arctica.AAC.1
MLRGSSGMNALKFEALRECLPRPKVTPPPGTRPNLKMLARQKCRVNRDTMPTGTADSIYLCNRTASTAQPSVGSEDGKLKALRLIM